jgi:hypothetical protein
MNPDPVSWLNPKINNGRGLSRRKTNGHHRKEDGPKDNNKTTGKKFMHLISPVKFLVNYYSLPHGINKK